MSELQASLSGLLPFAAYFTTGLFLLLAFMKFYTWMTPNDEVKLIKENNSAASLVFSAAAIGFSLPLASAAANSVSLIDFLVWGIIACVVQLAVYQIFRRFYPLVNERIEKGELAVSINLASISMIVGILNAACMSY